MEFSIWAITASIAIGILTNILTPHVLNLFSKISKSMKIQNEKKKVVFENSVQYLINNPQEEIIFKINYTMSVLGLFLLLYFSVFLMLSSNIVAIGVGFTFSLITYYSILRINNRRKISEELMKIKKAAHPEINLW